MPLCNAGNCLALATHGSVCAVHAKHPVTTHTRREQAEFLQIGVAPDFRPERYPWGDEDEDGWTTIASITLNNALSDTISIDAQLSEAGIELRVIDDAGGSYLWRPRTIAQPFSLRELISFIDRARGPCGRGLVTGVLNYNHRHGGVEATAMEEFISASSDVYSDLERHYRANVLLWVDERASRR